MQDAAADITVNGISSAGAGPTTFHEKASTADGDDGSAETRSRSLSGEFTLSHSDIALTDATQQTPEITVRPEQAAPGPESTVLIFTAYGERYEAFERTLERDPSVAELLRIDRTSDSRCYRVVFTDDTFTITTLLTRTGAHGLEVVGSDGSWDVHARFHSRQAFSAFRSVCSDNDIGFKLNKLWWNDRGTDWREAGLTPDQRDALQVAHEAGYFDVPRGVSQSELADELGVSPSAVSQRLRRATSQLIESQVGSRDS